MAMRASSIEARQLQLAMRPSSIEANGAARGIIQDLMFRKEGKPVTSHIFDVGNARPTTEVDDPMKYGAFDWINAHGCESPAKVPSSIKQATRLPIMTRNSTNNVTVKDGSSAQFEKAFPLEVRVVVVHKTIHSFFLNLLLGKILAQCS